jgi:aminopeptidase N
MWTQFKESASPKSSPTKGLAAEKLGEAYSKIDHSSLSSAGGCTNPAASTTHIHLNWTLDFDKRTLSGSAQHTVVLLEGCSSVAFDSSGLTISDVQIEGLMAEFVMAEKHNVLGTKVTVFLPENLRSRGKKLQITFVYQTSPDASAIQWLDPQATHGKKYPYVYTQVSYTHALFVFCFLFLILRS